MEKVDFTQNFSKLSLAKRLISLANGEMFVHQEFQVPKMEVRKNIISDFQAVLWVGEIPYISLIYS